MANLLVTRRCNRKCAHCFARGHYIVDCDELHPQASEDHISFDRFEEALLFLQRSDIGVIGLMGGEPGLHPFLREMVETILDRDLHVRLFTGGLISEGTAKFLAGLNPSRVCVVVNAPRPMDSLSSASCMGVQRTMQLLGPIASLSYTICNPEEDLGFLVKLIEQYNLRRSLRIGLCAPRMGDSSPAVLPPARYKDLAHPIVELAEACALESIAMEFDCGFTRCMFTEVHHRRLRELAVLTLFACGPVVDIDPDLMTWACFPMASMAKLALSEVNDRDQLIERFRQGQRAYRNLGVYEKCMTCGHKRRGECSGGCLAHVVRSFERPALSAS
jgi:sulfatase maturation enzyme AslB (radical SAM superfamily)